MKSALPIFALVALCLFIVLGVIMLGFSLQSADAGVNGTGNKTSVAVYEIGFAWWAGIALLGIIIAIGFAWWHFFG